MRVRYASRIVPRVFTLVVMTARPVIKAAAESDHDMLVTMLWRAREEMTGRVMDSVMFIKPSKGN